MSFLFLFHFSLPGTDYTVVGIINDKNDKDLSTSDSSITIEPCSAVSNDEEDSIVDLADLVRELNVTQSPKAYADLAEYWVQCFGADIIGGCCGVGVEHIREIAKRINVINQVQEKRMRNKLIKELQRENK